MFCKDLKRKSNKTKNATLMNMSSCSNKNETECTRKRSASVIQLGSFKIRDMFFIEFTASLLEKNKKHDLKLNFGSNSKRSSSYNKRVKSHDLLFDSTDAKRNERSKTPKIVMKPKEKSIDLSMSLPVGLSIPKLDDSESDVSDGVMINNLPFCMKSWSSLKKDPYNSLDSLFMMSDSSDSLFDESYLQYNLLNVLDFLYFFIFFSCLFHLNHFLMQKYLTMVQEFFIKISSNEIKIKHQ
jgi:hypothetical protein